MNTAIVTLTVSANIWPFNGPYSDFERGWYAVVGVAVLTTLLLNAVTSPTSDLFKWIIKSFKRSCLGRLKTHQSDILELYTNEPFDIAQRFARLLATVFATLMFSAGLPVVNLFAIVYFFATYWADKVILLWGSRRPPAFDSRMPKQAASILLFAAPLHMGVTVFIYSHQCTFPSSALGVSNVIESVTNISTDSSSRELSYLDRFTRQSTWMTAFGLGILVALWLFWIVLQILGASFGEMLKCLCVFLKPSLTEEEWTTVVVDGASGTTDVPTRVAPGKCTKLTWDGFSALSKAQMSYRFEDDPVFKILLGTTASSAISSTNIGGTSPRTLMRPASSAPQPAANSSSV